MIGVGPGISNVDEFNRRAAIALRGVDFKEGSFDSRFVPDMIRRIDAHQSLSESQQLTLYRVVNWHAKRLTDTLITDYAAQRIREA